MNRRSSRGKAYKKTTNKQYNVMIREIAKHLSDPQSKSKGEHFLFWCELRDKLNGLGPPTRNITEWKKVWNDCQRSRKRRELLLLSIKKPKEEPIDYMEGQDDAIDDDASRFNDIDDYQNESSQHSYDGDDANLDDSVTPFSLYSSSNSNPQTNNDDEPSTSHKELPLPPLYRCPPTLTYTITTPSQPQIQTQSVSPSKPQMFLNNFGQQQNETDFNQEILNILKSQIVQQTRLLEQVSQASSNMSRLMEQQLVAMERQTVAVRRQAIAMEHHTLVMNSFVDMIRDKMPKNINNSKTTNVSNGKT
ncbi:uncharacterized protein LOC142224022 [Haematobia irritans]|uniref:uncharacterized protein LOC142224022 n=1 Tax=Haematobia irritans TaxID=7368 RepID=UPI003F506334